MEKLDQGSRYKNEVEVWESVVDVEADRGELKHRRWSRLGNQFGVCREMLDYYLYRLLTLCHPGLDLSRDGF